MWSRFTGKSDSSSSKDNKDSKDSKDDRRRDSSTRAKRAESIVSSSSSRRPTRSGSEPRPTSSRNSYPPAAPAAPASVVSSYTTARDDGASEYSAYDAMDRPQRSRGANDDLYDDPRDDRYARRRDDRTPTYETRPLSSASSRRERSRSRDRDDRKRGTEKREKRKSRSDRSSTISQTNGYRGDIVESPKLANRSLSGQINSPGFNQFPGQMVSPMGTPMMSGALPDPTLSHPPPHSAPQSAPHPGIAHSASFGAAADFYGDAGDSVQHQPGVRPDRPSVIMPLDTPHLNAASAQFNPVEDTGAGSAADFYGDSNVTPSTAKPPRPIMPGSFTDEGPTPTKPPRPSSSQPVGYESPSKPGKPSKITSAATLAGGAALGYAAAHHSSSYESNAYNQSNTYHQSTTHQESNAHHSNGNPDGAHGTSAAFYQQGVNASSAATNGSYIPTYSEAIEGTPPPKPPRPGKPEKQSSGSSHAGLYAAAGAAGLAAYGLHQHNSHHDSHHTSSHNHSSSMPGAFPGDHKHDHQHNGQYGANPSSGPFVSGTTGMAQRHDHKGTVHRFVDWWKDHEDVQRMEEYTEYIGVCRGCFDPRSSVMDAPRKHHYGRKRSSEFRPSGIEKQSRYGLSEKPSRLSLSGDEKRKSSSNKTGWLAGGLATAGIAAAGKALWSSNRDDFDDTYSIKSGRDARSRVSHRSRSRSHERKQYSSSKTDLRYRSRSRDRMSTMSTGITGSRKDKKFVRRHSGSRSRSSSRDGKSGLIGAAIGAGLAASAVSAATGHSRKKRQNRSRSNSPPKAYVHHRRDSSDRERRYSKSYRSSGHRSSRSSVASGSFVDISQTEKPQGGILGGFFAAPPPKQKRRKSPSHSKKKKGFFNFGNASSSSSDNGLAFGAGYVKNRKKASRKSSDDKLNATLIGLGATAAAIAATQARSKNKRGSEVVAVKEQRNSRHSAGYRKSGRVSRTSVDEDGWESLPEDDTSDSGSMSSGLAFGDYNTRFGKSQESLASNGSGTNKWGWRWGSKKKKKPSTENLYNAGANTSLIGPTVAGAAAGAVFGTALGRQDSSTSSAPTLQNVYPVQSNDPLSFDARRTSFGTVPTPQTVIATRPNGLDLQQPQPIHQVPGAMYTTQPQPQLGYVAPSGPPVFSAVPPPARYSGRYDQEIAPPLPRRSNSSPIQSSSWKRDAAIAGGVAVLGATAINAAKSRDRQSSVSSPTNVRFELTKEQAKKAEREHRRDTEREEDEERRRRREQDRREEDERQRHEQQRRDEEARRLEDDRRAREQQRRDQEARREEEARQFHEQQRREEDEHRLREQQRRDEEARRYEAERLAGIEVARLEDIRRRERAERRDRDAREAAEQERRDHETARIEAQRREDLRHEAEQIERERRDTEIRQDAERRQREQEAFERHFQNDRERQGRELVQQATGSSISSDVRRREEELQEREREIVQPDTWKSTAAAAIIAGTAAAITSNAISSKRDKSSKRRDKSSTAKATEPKTIEPKIIEPSIKHVEPSKIAQDYADDDIFDRDLFKKKNLPKQSTTRDVFQELEDRYKEKDVSQADFFAPEELKDHSAPSPKIDPNEGFPGIHVSYAHDDLDLGPPRAPPYPIDYAFTPSKDGYAPSMTWAVPTLNLIQATPPGSRANSVRGVSVPPSPVIEPVEEPKKPQPTPEESRKSSRVSWGENQFHNYEVPTPDSFREQFVSDRDLKQQEKQSHDEIVVEADSPKSGRNIVSYRPERPVPAPEVPEVPASTQYVLDQETDDWASIPAKKVGKKDKKKAKAAAAAVAATTAAVAATALVKNDKSDKTSLSRDDPFSDSYAASAVSSSNSAYQPPYYGPQTRQEATSTSSSSSAYQPPYYGPPTQQEASVASEITAEPESMHIPGSFDEDPPIEQTVEEEWAAPVKKGKKGKKKSKDTEVEIISPQAQRILEQSPIPMPVPFVPESVIIKDVISEPEPEPTPSKKGKKKNKSKSADAEIVSPEAQRIIEQTPIPMPVPFVPEPTTVKEVISEPEPESKLSKKDKKKKAKAAKRQSVDPWDDSESSPTATPQVERDLRDIEPTFSAYPTPDKVAESTYTAYTPPSKPADPTYPAYSSSTTSGEPPYIAYSPPNPIETRDVVPQPASSQTNDSSSSTTKGILGGLAGGFAGLVFSSMRQDQDRMASEAESARQQLESAKQHSTSEVTASSTSNQRGLDDGEKHVSIPSTAFNDVEELVEAKTPKRKKEKRHSGKWSPSIGSPLRAEVSYEDYVGKSTGSFSSTKDQAPFYGPQTSLESSFAESMPGTYSSVQDSGYYAPDDKAKGEVNVERDSDEFFSAGSDDKKKTKAKSRESDKYDDQETRVITSPERKRDKYDDRENRSVISPERKRDKYEDQENRVIISPERKRDKYDDHDDRSIVSPERKRDRHDDRDNRSVGSSAGKYDKYDTYEDGDNRDNRSVVSPGSKSDRYDDNRSVISSGSRHDDDPDREERREERRRRRREKEKERERSASQNRGYEFDNEGQDVNGRYENDDRIDDWDSRSVISEARSEANGERRRKHKRREGERNGSPESRVRSRSSAASEPGDLYEDDRKSSKHKSRREEDFDDTASIRSSSSRHNDERNSRKEKERKEEKRSSGLFGLFSKSKESLVDTSSKSSKSRPEEEEDEKRRRRKHRDRGSTYGSDDDDARSTVSSSSKREKRRSRTDSREDDYSPDAKVH
ncbi:hypothetical protein B0J11DRAFT_535777 [Dendryphion nanum]|uniref:Involucrin repeat protein n=1 Tax=Dendryphion nanum TaxID=256645 RepID=A0A9P9DHE6_9PLEO|nr:hypothetical protein B0J11DRAFT_535777 [Dendryphion nanum]